MKARMLILLWILAMLLTGCTFDQDKHGVVDVIVVENHSDNITPQYYSVAPLGWRQKTKAFEPDDMAVYHVEFSGGDVKKVFGDGAEAVFRQNWYVYDDQGNQLAEEPPLIRKIMHRAARIDHLLSESRVLEVGEHIFLYVELNVNLHCPCELYYYDVEADCLTKVYSFSELETVGIRVRNIDLLR